LQEHLVRSGHVGSDAYTSAVDGGTEAELSDYLSVLRRQWRWIAGSVAVLVLVAVVLTLRQDDRYKASASVLLATSAAQDAVGATDTNTGLLARRLANELNYARSDAIKAAVVERLGEEPDVGVAGNTDSDVLTFTAIAPDAERAAAVANTWAAVYVEQKRADALASIAEANDQLVARLAQLRQRRAEVREPLDALQDELAGLPRAPADDATEAERARLEAEIDRLAGDLAPELDVIAAQEETVAESLATLEIQGELARTGTARVLNEAAVPTASTSAPLSRNLLLAVAGGLVVGICAALLRDKLDSGLKDAADAERAAGVPVLASIPRVAVAGADAARRLSLAVAHDPSSSVADGYSRLRTALQFAMLDGRIRSVLVTSPNQSEGKTTTSSNVAWSMAVLGHRTVVVDGDNRRPQLDAVFRLRGAPGLTDHLLSGVPLDHVGAVLPAGDDALKVVPTGPLPPNPADFVSSTAYRTAIDELAGLSDVLVVDGPPVLPVSDALSVARYVDAVVVVAMVGRTSAEDLRAAVLALQRVGADVIGVVLVGSDTRESYGYYAPDEVTSRRTPGRKHARRRGERPVDVARTG